MVTAYFAKHQTARTDRAQHYQVVMRQLSRVQWTSKNHIPPRPILILCLHLRLLAPHSSCHPLGFSTKILCKLYFKCPPYVLHVQPVWTFFIQLLWQYWVKSMYSEAPYCVIFSSFLGPKHFCSDILALCSSMKTSPFRDREHVNVFHAKHEISLAWKCGLRAPDFFIVVENTDKNSKCIRV
jgi:hypothetical protein